MELAEIRAHWNQILDLVLEEDRIAWLAFFDARLAQFDGTVLTLDFSDSRKFGSAHEYSDTRRRHQLLLIKTIKSCLNIDIEVSEI